MLSYSYVNKFSLSDAPTGNISCLCKEVTIDIWQAGRPQSLLHHLVSEQEQ